MKIGITGMSGFIGGRVAEATSAAGHEPVGFSRRQRPGWRVLDAHPDLSGLDAVVNLAGESIFGLWTAEKKQRIVQSRVDATRHIVDAMAASPERPKVLVNGSAIGFYGDTGERIVDETSGHGIGFLADTCRAWEAEALRAESIGVRVVFIRTGFVIGRGGGAMALIKPVFSLGLGGNLGSGRQWMSGIHVDDVAGMCLWAAENTAIHGPVNAVLPEPTRNADFTRGVARTLRRPAFLPAPEFAIRAVLGELSTLLLDSSRVVPRMAEGAGYSWRHRTLESALAEALGK